MVLFPADAREHAIASEAFERIERIAKDPAAICFRQDLLEAAGIPSDPTAFASLLASNGGGWDQFLAVGRVYREITGDAWFGDEQLLWASMEGQVQQSVSAGDRDVASLGEGELARRQGLFDGAVEDGLSAGESWWDWRGGAALLDDSFAVTPCTPGIRNVMVAALGTADVGNAKWAVADFFPGGSWSFADVYVGIRADAGMNDEAVQLFTWLTEAEGQAAIAEAQIGVPELEDTRFHWKGSAWVGSQDIDSIAAIDRNRADFELE